MNKDQQECYICFEILTYEAAFKGMKCKHLYHSQCLKEYINQYEAQKKIHSCPIDFTPYNFKLLNVDDTVHNEISQVSCQKKYDELSINMLCYICHEEYTSQTDLPTSLSSCIHIYHSECIKKCLNRCGTKKKSGECPQCRTIFEEVNLKPRKDIFDQLLQMKEQAFSDLKINNMCTICLEEYISITNCPNSLPCNHVFHKDCITKWLSTCGSQQIEGKCPNCKNLFEVVSLKERLDIFRQLSKLKSQIDSDAFFNVFLKDFINQTRSLQVKRSMSVSEFAGKAEEILGVAKNTIQFAFQGKTFSFFYCPDKRLGDFSILTNSTIYALMRSRGGEQ